MTLTRRKIWKMKTITCLITVLLGCVSLTNASETDPLTASLIMRLAEDTHAMCRLGEGTEATIKAACDTRDIYWDALAELGYCFDTGERTWVPCKSSEN